MYTLSKNTPNSEICARLIAESKAISAALMLLLKTNEGK